MTDFIVARQRLDKLSKIVKRGFPVSTTRSSPLTDDVSSVPVSVNTFHKEMRISIIECELQMTTVRYVPSFSVNYFRYNTFNFLK